MPDQTNLREEVQQRGDGDEGEGEGRREVREGREGVVYQGLESGLDGETRGRSNHLINISI